MIEVRSERPDDRESIYRVNREAFGQEAEPRLGVFLRVYFGQKW